MAKKRNFDAPQFHGDHPRPVTRRQFVAQGFMSGAAYATGAGVLSLFANPQEVLAQSNLSADLQALLFYTDRATRCHRARSFNATRSARRPSWGNGPLVWQGA